VPWLCFKRGSPAAWLVKSKNAREAKWKIPVPCARYNDCHCYEVALKHARKVLGEIPDSYKADGIVELPAVVAIAIMREAGYIAGASRGRSGSRTPGGSPSSSRNS